MTVKSQDDLGKQGRDVEVLLEAISKLETTTKELERVKKQLAIAIEALDSLRGICYPWRAEEAFNKIKELEK